MAKPTLEQIDYLREKASITYEEALDTLERFDGDIARCLVDLERKGRIKPPTRKPNTNEDQYYRYEYRYGQDRGFGFDPRNRDGRDYNQNNRGKAFVLDGEAIKQALFSHIVVRKGERIIANLPIAYLTFAAFMAPHLLLASVLLIFLMGYHIKWERKQEERQRANDLFAFVDKTAENIRRTADNFARAVKNEVCPQPSREEERPVYGSAQQPAQPVQPTQPEAPKPTATQPEAPKPASDEHPGEITIE